MTTSPWSFVVFNEKANTTNATEGRKSGRPAVSVPKEETVEVAPTDEEEEEEEEDDNTNPEEDKKSYVTQDEAEINIVTERPIEASAIEEFGTTEDDDDDDGDDDDDEDNDAISGNVTLPASIAKFNLTDKYSPVAFPDGTVEYNLKMLSEEEIQLRKEVPAPKKKRDASVLQQQLIHSETTSEEGRSKSRPYSRKMKRKHMRTTGRRYSRKTRIQLEGIQLIERIGDVLLGSRENSTNRIIDIQLQIGPIQFVINEVTSLTLQSRVTFPALMARLRLTVGNNLGIALVLLSLVNFFFQNYVDNRRKKVDMGSI